MTEKRGFTSTQKKVNHEGTVKGVHLLADLTAAEKDVLHLLTVEFCTPAEVSRRRRTSLRATRKHIASLRKKGVLSKFTYTPVTPTYTPQGMGELSELIHPIRLHGERYRIRLLESGREYAQARQRTNSILLDGNRVVLYRDTIMVFSFQSFSGATCDDCEHEAADYWFRFFNKLEGYLKIKILKARAENIKQVFFHFAEVGNELAGKLRRDKQKLRVFGTRDGKEWLLFDDSNKLEEAETTRPPTAIKTAKDDMGQVVQPFFNDLRDHSGDVMLPSQLAHSIKQTVAIVHENASTLQSILKLMQAQMPDENAQEQKPAGWRPPYVG